MARAWTPALKAALTGQACRPVLFYEGEFQSGTVRLWSEIGSVDWNGQTWTGIGGIAAISTIEETGNIEARGIVVTLNGIPPALIEVALAEARQGKPGKIWIGGMTEANRIIADPYLGFWGRLDVPEIAKQGASAVIRITYENRLIGLDRARERRFTHEDQQIDYPGDLGFEYVNALQDAKLTWGRG